MKKTLLSSIIFLLYTASFAQKVQFTDPTNIWSWSDSTFGCCVLAVSPCTFSYYDSTTLTYNGYTYQSLISSTSSILVRENAGRVYVIATPDSLERVLYDFNLALHDTMRTIYPYDYFTAWVTHMDSTKLAGVWYKVWHFEGTDSLLYYPDSFVTVSYNVVEGLGCTNGVYYPAYPYYRNSYFQHLLCFQNHLHPVSAISNPVASFGFGYIGGYFDNDSSCRRFVAPPDDTTLQSTGVKPIAGNSNYVSVIPNPVNENTRIVFPSAIASGTIIVLNSIGQVLIDLSFRDKNQILIGDKIKVPGVYCYRVLDTESGKVFSGKLVHQ